ncbi:murein L,D-transpeptidase catalytic domain family protein [Butyricimonas sp. Marseille-P3923]|uniref:murein L,D-transpeptidase catalytic domain family protein n=1 Tax=Butyricimonas sp. Marseille-P3923 TaxID=1987504 RepID=UPI00210041DA|nr:murein L,D-transpeptidase catalytic domain family protein [Butyricimonas sp. Marseille-P3923]
MAQPCVAAERHLPVNSKTLYHEIGLEGIVDYALFERAIAGYNQTDSLAKDILTLIDFSKPSTEKRLYVVNLRLKKLLYVSYVSHGRNSGEKYATSFSNKEGSYKSSLGFYRTENTYYGKNGYSLILDGLEKGINDNAKERAIVMHGAAYADPSTIRSCGRLGRSLGCPALPLTVCKKIIDTIKGGTLLYIHGDDKTYAERTAFAGDTDRKIF